MISFKIRSCNGFLDKCDIKIKGIMNLVYLNVSLTYMFHCIVIIIQNMCSNKNFSKLCLSSVHFNNKFSKTVIHKIAQNDIAIHNVQLFFKKITSLLGQKHIKINIFFELKIFKKISHRRF